MRTLYTIEHKIWDDEKSNCIITPDRVYRLQARVNDRLIKAIQLEVDDDGKDHYTVYWEKTIHIPDWG